jgi:hypothetical protein
MEWPNQVELLSPEESGGEGNQTSSRMVNTPNDIPPSSSSTSDGGLPFIRVGQFKAPPPIQPQRYGISIGTAAKPSGAGAGAGGVFRPHGSGPANTGAGRNGSQGGGKKAKDRDRAGVDHAGVVNAPTVTVAGREKPGAREDPQERNSGKPLRGLVLPFPPPVGPIQRPTPVDGLPQGAGAPQRTAVLATMEDSVGDSTPSVTTPVADTTTDLFPTPRDMPVESAAPSSDPRRTSLLLVPTQSVTDGAALMTSFLSSFSPVDLSGPATQPSSQPQRNAHLNPRQSPSQSQLQLSQIQPNDPREKSLSLSLSTNDPQASSQSTQAQYHSNMGASTTNVVGMSLNSPPQRFSPQQLQAGVAGFGFEEIGNASHISTPSLSTLPIGWELMRSGNSISSPGSLRGGSVQPSTGFQQSINSQGLSSISSAAPSTWVAIQQSSDGTYTFVTSAPSSGVTPPPSTSPVQYQVMSPQTNQPHQVVYQYQSPQYVYVDGNGQQIVDSTGRGFVSMQQFGNQPTQAMQQQTPQQQPYPYQGGVAMVPPGSTVSPATPSLPTTSYQQPTQYQQQFVAPTQPLLQVQSHVAPGQQEYYLRSGGQPQAPIFGQAPAQAGQGMHNFTPHPQMMAHPMPPAPQQPQQQQYYVQVHNGHPISTYPY